MASEPSACVRRNVRQLVSTSRGAGPIRPAARIRRIVPAPTRWPSPTSSAWIRRCRRVAPVHYCTGAPSEPDMPVIRASGSSKPRRSCAGVAVRCPLYSWTASSGPFAPRAAIATAKARLSSRLTCPSAPANFSTSSLRLTRPRQPAFAAEQLGSVSGRLYGSIRLEDRHYRCRFPRCLSATGIGFLGVLFPPGIQLPSRSACRPRPSDATGPGRVFHVPHA